jgi:UDP-N-acetylglucosamine 2-epimerase (non-hydrolysing)
MTRDIVTAYKKILIIFGTRPEAIKMAPIIKRLYKTNLSEVFVCVSAQHRQMLDQVLDLYRIKPDYDLNLMSYNQGLENLTASILIEVSKVLEILRPDLVLVHGDTTTSVATSLACFYKKIPVAHVEAGLRSGNIQSPWPEELNRRIVSQIAFLHFAPTALSKLSLVKEGIVSNRIWVTGNTVIDALLDAVNHISKNPILEKKLLISMPWFHDPLKKIILVTGHRRENFGEGIDGICRALRNLALDPNVIIIYPVHPNPNVMEPVHRILKGISNIYLVEPMEYLTFVFIMSKAYFIITDSGGIQEEAPTLGKPVLVVRETTERPEAILAGTVHLVGANETKIIHEARRLLQDPNYYALMANSHNPYGDGQAARRIVKVIHGQGEIDELA